MLLIRIYNFQSAVDLLQFLIFQMYFTSILICFALLATSIAVSTTNENEAQIISYENTNDGTGNYQFK